MMLIALMVSIVARTEVCCMTRDEIETLFKRWRKPLRQYLSHRKMFSPSDLDDLCQEVFERLLRWPTDIPIKNQQGYIFRTAINVANEWQERRVYSAPHNDSWLEELADTFDQESEAERDGENARIVAAMESLPIDQQRALRAHIFDDLTHKEIAVKFGITRRKVLRDLNTAYVSLRAALPDLCVERPRDEQGFLLPPDRDRLIAIMKSRPIDRCALHFGVQVSVFYRWMKLLDVEYIDKAYGSKFHEAVIARRK